MRLFEGWRHELWCSLFFWGREGVWVGRRTSRFGTSWNWFHKNGILSLLSLTLSLWRSDATCHTYLNQIWRFTLLQPDLITASNTKTSSWTIWAVLFMSLNYSLFEKRLHCALLGLKNTMRNVSISTRPHKPLHWADLIKMSRRAVNSWCIILLSKPLESN